MHRHATLALAVVLVVGSFAVSPLALGQAKVPTALGQDTTTTEAPDLDLREANVVGVEFQRVEPGAYDFSVTLLHDDDGESGFADRWQVETLNGTELDRRELVHAHGTQPFTRSARVDVPENVSLVVVRGHDQTHGFGGQAMVVALRTGATEAIRQGSDARNFSECEVVEDESVTTGTTAATETTIEDATGSTTTEDATGTTTENATGTTTTETDLLNCPWEENTTEETTTG